ncbi:hypothetical protein EST38_g12927 [Candolleomyces aberdarensis]|uniref:Uncharacterized protein n=1 Tax=Candolleomyces aberdarensis TaxID=2316362 RepID=A0A4Q2D467_9AGAR|nr:hypothetical protein EST38_g12927 [Candolleomyces aberdarensis]
MYKLKAVLESEDVKTLRIPDGGNGHPELFSSVYIWTFGDYVRDLAHYHPGYPVEIRLFLDGGADERGRKRIYPIIMSAFVIASTRKTKVMGISDWYSMIPEGLHISDYDVVEDKDVQEIAAIAALVFFATLGAEQMASQSYDLNRGQTYDTVLDVLKSLKERGIVRYERGVLLLERVISDVEKHDKKERSIKEVWRELVALDD